MFRHFTRNLATLAVVVASVVVVPAFVSVDQAGATVPTLTWTPAAAQGVGQGMTVSCPSTSFCMRGYSANTSNMLANSDGTNSASTLFAVAAVSCVSSTFCMAVDFNGLASTYNGSTWSAAATGNIWGHSGTEHGTSISCASTTLCVAGGSTGDAAVWTSGTTWSVTQISAAPLQVSCAPSSSPVLCGAAATDVWSTFDGTSWSTPDTSAAVGGAGLSCPTTTFCASVDSQSGGGETTGTLSIWNGSTWGEADSAGFVVSTTALNAISCPTSTQCYFTDTSSGFWEWTPGTVDQLANVSTNGAPRALSCPATTFCAEVDGSGSESYYFDRSVNQVIQVPTGVVYGASATYGTVADSTVPLFRPTGQITFSVGATTLCTATLSADSTPGESGASCTSTSAPAGTDTLTSASASGFLQADSATASLSVAQQTSTTVLATIPSTLVFSQTVPLSATVTPENAGSALMGTVSFSDNGTLISGCKNVALDSSDIADCSTPASPIGDDSFTATYGNDPNTSGSLSNSQSSTVSAASTSLSLGSSANPSVAGQNVTFTATVSSEAPATGVPTGTVDFTVDGNPASCSSATLSNGVATCQLTFADVGSYTVAAQYQGTTDYAGSAAGLATNPQGVVADDSSVSVTSTPTSPLNGESTDLIATVSADAPGSVVPTGTVTFYDASGSPVFCSDQALSASPPYTATCVTSFTRPAGGSVSVKADFVSSTEDLNSSSSPATAITIGQGQTTTSITDVGSNPSVAGESVTYDVEVSPTAPASGFPTGQVTVSDGTTSCQATLSSGQGSCSLAETIPGTRTVTASYPGDGGFTSSVSDGISQQVTMASTTTTLSSGTNPSVAGQSVLFTAVVAVQAPGSGTPTGQVTISDGSQSCQATLSGGVGSCDLAEASAGTSDVTATYGGDDSYATSTSNTVSQVVDQASTSVLLASGANPSVVGQLVTFTATVSADAPGSGTPTGQVTISDGVQSCQGTLTGGQANCTLVTDGFPSELVTASYGGDDNFSSSQSTTLDQLVGAASTTTTVAPSTNPSVVGQPVTYTAHVAADAPSTSTPTGHVTISDGVQSCQGTLSGGQATCTLTYGATGHFTVSAQYPGVTGFDLSISTTVDQVVDQAGSAMTLATSAQPVLAGQAATYTATVAPVAPGAGAPSGTVTFSVDGTPACTAVTLAAGVAHCAAASVPGASFEVEAVYSGDADFTGSSATLTQNTKQGYLEVTRSGSLLSFGALPAFAGPPAQQGVVGVALTPDGAGAWMTTAAGVVTAAGDAVSYGSAPGALDAPIVGIAADPDGHGYWLVASDGGVFAFGSAAFFGSMGGRALNSPVVGMAGAATGHGYWLVASDGGVFAFGAPFAGSMGGQHLNAPVVGIGATSAGGYWLVASDGGVFSFGGAPFEGSVAGLHLTAPVIGLVPTPFDRGYWLMASDGGVFALGDATYLGGANTVPGTPGIAAGGAPAGVSG